MLGARDLDEAEKLKPSTVRFSKGSAGSPNFPERERERAREREREEFGVSLGLSLGEGLLRSSRASPASAVHR